MIEISVTQWCSCSNLGSSKCKSIVQSIITPCLLVCATNLLNIIVLKGRTPRLAPRKAVDQAVSLQTDNISPTLQNTALSHKTYFFPSKQQFWLGKRRSYVLSWLERMVWRISRRSLHQYLNKTFHLFWQHENITTDPNWRLNTVTQVSRLGSGVTEGSVPSWVQFPSNFSPFFQAVKLCSL